MDAANIIKLIPSQTKHGPGGRGGAGPCETDCVKCLAEEWIKNTEPEADGDFKHCDDYIHDYNAPRALRLFLLVHRLPAVDGALLYEEGLRPTLFANYKGKRVRVVMASRFGDVGITERLDAETGYSTRVPVESLSNFSKEKT